MTLKALKVLKYVQYIFQFLITVLCFIFWISISSRAYKERVNIKKMNQFDYGLSYGIAFSNMMDSDSSFYTQDKSRALYDIAPYGSKWIYIYFNQYGKAKGMKKN